MRGPSPTERRTGSTIIGIAACWRRRWIWNAVSLWRTRPQAESSSKRSWPATKSAFGYFLMTSRPSFSASTATSVPVESSASAGELERRREALVLLERLVRALLELVHLADALEVAGVDDRDREEHDALEVVREHAEQREERVTAEPAVAADEDDRDGLRSDRSARAPSRAPRSLQRIGQLDVEPADARRRRARNGA